MIRALIGAATPGMAKAARDAAELAPDLNIVAATDRVAVWAKARYPDLVAGLNNETRKVLQTIVQKGIDDGLGADALADTIQGRFKDWRRAGTRVVTIGGQRVTVDTQSRAELVARSETADAFNEGTLDAYEEAAIGRVLVHDGTEDPECDKANGETWSVREARERKKEHPNCVRAFSAVVTKISEALPPTTPTFRGPTIPAADVGEFLAESQVKDLVVHRTSFQAARSITKGGVDLSKTASRSTFGEGFYTSEQAVTFYGEEQLNIAIRTLKPFRGTAQQMDDKIASFALQAPEKKIGDITVRFWDTGEQQHAIRQAFLDEGFDSLIVEQSGNNIIVGIVEDNIKVVVN